MVETANGRKGEGTERSAMVHRGTGSDFAGLGKKGPQARRATSDKSAAYRPCTREGRETAISLLSHLSLLGGSIK